MSSSPTETALDLRAATAPGPRPDRRRPTRSTRSTAISRIAVLVTTAAIVLGGAVALPPIAASAAPATSGLAAALDEVLAAPEIVDGATSLRVIDADDGTVLYDRQGSTPMKPASNAKLLTEAAALELLGPSFRFHTDVLADGTVDADGVLDGDLILKGYGDPTTMDADLAGLAGRLQASGITRVSGDLVADASFFDAQPLNPFWNPADFPFYYSAQISALTIAPNTDFDSGTVIIDYAAARVGRPASIDVVPAEARGSLTIDNRTRTTAAGTPDTVEVTRATGTNTIVISGNVPAGEGDQEWVTVDRPALVAAGVFADLLADRGITVDGELTTGVAPAGATRLARDLSMPLAELSVPFMKLSNNMHAEHLIKTLGARNGRPGNWADGNARVRSFLTRQGVPLTGVTLVDGSGLAHANRIPTSTLTTALRSFRSEPWFDVYYGALPVAGEPDRWIGGTLRTRMLGSAAASNLRGKTGSLSGVTALSGYVTGTDGRRYIFAMLSRYDGDSPRAVEDAVGITLASWPSTAEQ